MGNQMLLTDVEIEVGPLIVDSFKNSGKIKESEFSFAMNGFYGK